MKITTFVLFLFILNKAIKGENDYELKKKFLGKFLMDKRDVIINTCWEKSVLIRFVKSMINKTKFIYFHNGNAYRKRSKYLEENYYFHRSSSLQNFPQTKQVILDLENCPTSWTILRDLHLFPSALKWLVLANKLDNEIFSHKPNVYRIMPNHDLILAKIDNGSVVLRQPYKTHETGVFLWEDYGSFADNKLYEKLKNVPLQSRRRDLKKTEMNMTLVLNDADSLNHLSDFRFPRIDIFAKENHGAIVSLLEYCNVSYGIITNDLYGYYNNTTKEFNGMIDDLHKRRAQISGSSPLFTKERLEVVDYIKMQNPLEVAFLLKKPPLSYTYNIFVGAFKTNVWICIAVILIMFSGALYIILNCENNQIKRSPQWAYTISDVALVALEVLCQQGTMAEPKSTSGRIITLFFFAAFMFFYVSYSADIVVLLQSTTVIKDAEELRNSRLRVGAQETNYIRYYMPVSKNLMYKKLYEQKIGPNAYYSLEDGMALVQEGFFAFHVELGPAYNYVFQKFTNHEICNLQTIEGYIHNSKGYTCIPKNSPYKEIFKVGLLKIDEYGIQRRNYLRYHLIPKCFSHGGSFESVGIVETYTISLILIYGVCLAFLVFLCERIAHELINKKINKTK